MMSTALYLNKAARLQTHIEDQIDAFKQNVIENICANTDAVNQPNKTALIEGVNAIFENWQSNTAPQITRADNGAHMVIIPHSDLKFNKKAQKKKEGAQYRITNARIFMVSPLKQLSLYRMNFIDNGKKAFENVRSYYQNMLNDDQPYNVVPRFGKKIFDQNALDIAHMFKHRDSRYQSQIGPSAYIQSQLRQVARIHGGEITVSRKDIDHFIQNTEKAWLKTAQYSILARLNRDALHAAMLNTQPSYRDYQWMLAGNSAREIDYRIGAFKSYPGLTPLFSLKHVSEWDYNALRRRDGMDNDKYNAPKKLNALIDQGISVPAALKNVFAEEAGSIPKKYLAPYHGVNDRHIENDDLNILSQKLNFLPYFERHEYPMHSKAWQDFKNACEDLESAHKYSRLPYSTLRQYIRKNPNKNVAWRDIQDFVRKVRNTIILPSIVQTMLSEGDAGDVLNTAYKLSQNENIITQFMSGFSVPQLVRGSEQWHERLDTVNARLKSIAIASDLSWPALCPEQKTARKVHIIPLTTKIELEEEGERMSHCVGGYASNCILTGSHIFHLSYTDQSGEAHSSTLQLTEYNEDKKMKVKSAQHKKYKNKTPHGELIKAANWLVSSINSEKITVDWPVLKSKRQSIADAYNENRLINDIGFDPRKRDFCEDAFAIMGEFLPDKIRNMTYDVFLAHAPHIAGIKPALDSLYKEEKASYKEEAPAIGGLHM